VTKDGANVNIRARPFRGFALCKLTHFRDYIKRMASAAIKLFCPWHLAYLDQIEDSLICEDGCNFRIIKGIPRFTDEQYSSAFGFQWKKFPRTQLDSFSGTSTSKNRVVQVCGEELYAKLPESTVLEVGAGAGRFTEALLATGATVFSCDLSSAVEVNAESFPISAKHSVIQSDVTHLPFLPESFEIVFCLGVIQHTPSPERTIECLAKQVKPGGWLLIDHYAKSISWKFRTAPLARAILKRLKPDTAFRIAEKIFKIAKPLFKVSKNRIYRKFLNIIFPIVYFDDEILELKAELRDEWSILDTFDSLTDWHKHRRSPKEIEKSLIRSGLVEIVCFRGGNGVVARGRKPIL
jgi:2-polyprenyl-3-methyl-5-hydroxy-6-metoxy-1,4-benzoquinol methylase